MADPARIEVRQHTHVTPFAIEVAGSHWGAEPVRILVDGETSPSRLRVLEGTVNDGGIEPDEGRFVALLDVVGVSAGSHSVVAAAADRDGERAEDEFELLEVPDLEPDMRPTMRWLRRREDFNLRRFPEGRTYPGARLEALEHRNEMRQAQADEAGPAVSPGANWYPIGPSVVRNGQVFGTSPSTYVLAPISGRVTDLAIDPLDPQTVYAATAQGGLWKSVNNGRDWEPKTDFTPSLACGSVTVDPSVTDGNGRSARIFVGTGEPNGSDSYYGAGVLVSTDGGDTWATRATATFRRASFSTIAVDPGNNQHLLAATDAGVFESNDEGVSWTLLEAGLSHDLCVDWGNAAGAEVYVGRRGVGVRRRIGSGSWTTLGGGLPAAPARVALAMAPSDPNILYAAIPPSTGSGEVAFYKTTDGGETWVAAGTVSGGQFNYNLVLAVHPSDPSIVLFGEVHLWRTTNSGGTWTRVSTGSPGIHADQHALAFDPTDGSRVFAGNDGGAWLSADAGVTWRHRNKDLATLQYFGAASHGEHEAVMLGGTQDNGAQRYLGHPAWDHSALGDGAFCAISRTGDTHRWYETRYYSFPCFRSDASGERGTWNQKQTGITPNPNWFYPPLTMDPNNSSVLYCGFDRLYRTEDNADNWAAITGSISGGSNITAIAVAPSDSATVYVGLRNGRVFRVAGSGASWGATDISGAPIPAGQISDIAVHPTDPNTVYVTTSDLIFSKGSESFEKDHVYRTQDGGANWASVSSGLSPANPINAIAIDPSNPQVVFIGGDVGIFRSDDAGANWIAWDQGLPNCSVQDLLFTPQRLLRAATHGRSLWERPVDATEAPLVSLYVRDNVLDTGRATPSPSDVVHPFDSTQWVYWWQSADLKVDAPDPATNAYAFGGGDIDYLQFEELLHDNPRRGTSVRLYAQLHARGNEPATNVQARAFWADASAAVPPLPTDFWSAFPDSDPVDTSQWHPVGPKTTIASLAPERPRVVTWKWQVPSNAPSHCCMLLVTTCDEDPVGVTTTDVGSAVKGSSHVTQKNLHVDELVPGAVGTESPLGPYMIDLPGGHKELGMDIRFNTRGLPRGTRIHVVLPPFEPLGKGEVLRGLEETDEVPALLRKLGKLGRDRSPHFDLERAFVLETGKSSGGKRQRPGLYGVRPASERFAAGFAVTLPDTKIERAPTFHIEQWVREELVGGSSYELRLPPGWPDPLPPPVPRPR